MTEQEYRKAQQVALINRNYAEGYYTFNEWVHLRRIVDPSFQPTVTRRAGFASSAMRRSATTELSSRIRESWSTPVVSPSSCPDG